MIATPLSAGTDRTNEGRLFVERAIALIGPRYVKTDPHETEPYRTDWRGRYRRDALAVVLPGSAAEVAAIVELCRSLSLPIVPQAGNTGLTGGAVPSLDGRSVLLNVSRLNRVREVDVGNNAMTVEAGCILADIRRVADENGRLFPMLLGSVGSCEIGGLVSTNAGGTGVLRYGNMRELVLGLEVVLPDGRIWNGLRALRKDNSGYDLKQLFIGAEGTLGIVTAAVLKLHPKPLASATAMVSLGSVESAIALLGLLQTRIGNRIEAFEIMSRSQLEVLLEQRPDLSSPMAVTEPWYVLLEVADAAADWKPEDAIETALAAALEADLITDAVVAADLAKAHRIWELRHNISEANRNAGFTVGHDTSVPISRLPRFIETVTTGIEGRFPEARICHCGHLGDGNVHVVVVLPRTRYREPDTCETAAAAINAIVHETSVALGGSISAEHGVGLMHVRRLQALKPALDLDLMRVLKTAFDPDGLLNPGKILAARA